MEAVSGVGDAVEGSELLVRVYFLVDFSLADEVAPFLDGVGFDFGEAGREIF